MTKRLYTKDVDAISFTKDAVAGGVSGVISKTALAPIERVKLLLQTQFINKDVGRHFTGPIHCISTVVKEQGFLSLWRGNLANCIRYIPNASMTFAFNEKYKYIFVGNVNKNESKLGFYAGSLLSGGLAGATALLVCHPLDVARTRMGVDMNKTRLTRLYSGLSDCIRQVYRANGVAGLYAGFTTSIGGVVLFKSLFLGGYEIIKEWMIAQSVTTVAGTLCYPLDTIKRRMMIQNKHHSSNDVGGHVAYRSGYHAFVSIMKVEGVRGLFSGLSANLIRGLSGPILLLGYEFLQKKFKDE